MSNAGATKTANDRLAAIEAWSRRTFIAASAAAVLVAIPAVTHLYFWYEFGRFAPKIDEMMCSLSEAGPRPASKGGIVFDPAQGIADMKARLLGGAPAPAPPAAAGRK